MKVGLTGGVASGKSTVAKMFADLGITVIDTDVIAREVVTPGQPAIAEIRQAFGEDVIAADGGLDRKAMRALVFADDAKRQALERILHPRIRESAKRQSANAAGPYHLVVVPLLTESPMREEMDRIVVVDCSEDVQLARLLERDADTEQQARRIIAAQTDRDSRLAIADDVIDNGGDLEATRRQVAELHEKYLSHTGDN